MKFDAHVHNVGFIHICVTRFPKTSKSRLEFCPTFLYVIINILEGHGKTNTTQTK